MVYDSLDALNFDLGDCRVLPQPERVLLTRPDHFDVQYVINPHMEGKEGSVNKAAAQRQWDELRRIYTELELDVNILDGVEGLPDMVFCANQTLPYLNADGNRAGVILSRMHADQRKGEVPHYARFFRENDYEVQELPADIPGSFEGMGDALWHAGRRLLWGGYGFRTEPSVYQTISEMIDAPVVLLNLADKDFYHLDTCLSILDEGTALVHLDAFDDEGCAILDTLFDTLIDTPEDEARRGFACNVHCPDGEHVLIHESCDRTMTHLADAGFEPIGLDTSEFLKSGGSVFCMKMMYW